MPTLSVDMPSGIAGDMLLGALIACGADAERIGADLLGLGVGPLPLHCEAASPGGIAAVRLSVAVPQEADWQPTGTGHDHGDHHHHDEHHAAHQHHHEHHHGDHGHRSWSTIRQLLQQATLPERVRRRSLAAFQLLAEAEAAVHGVDPETVHFHEVGSLDAIADVVGCCLALEQLGVDHIVGGPLTLGQGHVHCAHGRMPVPVPAVLEMLRRRPAPARRLTAETGELTTPTGAALILSLADSFDPAELGPPTTIGYGAGHKSVPGLTNLLRVCLHDPTPVGDPVPTVVGDRIHEIRCSIDDSSGEELAELLERLLAAGARDAWLVPCVMKKGRPGHEVVALCDPESHTAVGDLLLQESSSIGYRWQAWDRRVLPRRELVVEVAGAPIRVKEVVRPDGSRSAKPADDDLRRLARTTGQRRQELAAAALAVWRAGGATASADEAQP